MISALKDCALLLLGVVVWLIFNRTLRRRRGAKGGGQ